MKIRYQREPFLKEENAYRDMFLSFMIPYIMGVIIYYAAVFHEIKSANQALKEIKEHYK